MSAMEDEKQQLRLDYHEWLLIPHEIKQQYKMSIKEDLPNQSQLLADIDNALLTTKSDINYEDIPKVAIVFEGNISYEDEEKTLETIKRSYFIRKYKFSSIPGANKVIVALKKCLPEIQSKNDVSVCLRKFPENERHVYSVSDLTSKRYGGAMFPNENRVMLYTGNFTDHDHVETIVIFISKESNVHCDANLKALFSLPCGEHLKDYFEKEIQSKKYIGVVQTAIVSKLKYTKLVYCFMKCFKKSGDINACLKLKDILSETSDSYVLTSPCSSPLNYPPEEFAKFIIENMNETTLSNISVNVYDNVSNCTITHKEFVNSARCRIIAKSFDYLKLPKILDNSAETENLISIVKDNRIHQRANVHVIFLDCTGSTLALPDDLPKYIKDTITIKLAVNLPLESCKVLCIPILWKKCKNIYFVGIPDFRDFEDREPLGLSMENILIEIKKFNVKSLSISTSGLLYQHYSTDMVAEVIFSEIIKFIEQNHGVLEKIYIIVPDEQELKIFNRFHVHYIGDLLRTKSIPNNPSRSSDSFSQNLEILVERGDISEQRADVIVNTTSENMLLSKTPVSKALLKKAGTDLQDQCNMIIENGYKLSGGNVAVTDAYELKCKKIFHIHIPPRHIISKSGQNWYNEIQNIIHECLRKAEYFKYYSISFPLVASTKKGYIIEEIAGLMLSAMRRFGKKFAKCINTVKIVIKTKSSFIIFANFFFTFFETNQRSNEKTRTFIAKFQQDENNVEVNTSRHIECSLNSIELRLSSVSIHNIERAFHSIQSELSNSICYKRIKLLPSSSVFSDPEFMMKVTKKHEVSVLMTKDKEGIQFIIGGVNNAVEYAHENLLQIANETDVINLSHTLGEAHVFVNKMCQIFVHEKVKHAQSGVTIGESSHFEPFSLEQNKILISDQEWMLFPDEFKAEFKKYVEGPLPAYQKTQSLNEDLSIESNQRQGEILFNGMSDKMKCRVLKLQSIAKSIYHHNYMIKAIPGSRKLSENIKEEISSIQSKYDVSIKVEIISDHRSDHASKQQYIGGALCFNENRILLYAGSFVEHEYVDTMVIFVPREESNSILNTTLSTLFSSPSGQALKNKYELLRGESSGCGVIKTCCVGSLRCHCLVFCVLHVSNGDESNDSRYLESVLREALDKTSQSNAYLLTSVCSSPLKYSVASYTESLIKTLSKYSSSVVASVYDNDLEYDEFEKIIIASKYKCRLLTGSFYSKHLRVKDTSFDTVINLVHGDILQLKADVSVKIMDRSMREVEKKSLQPAPHILCKVCCTDSSNLPWKYIFNVCIPNYKEIKNEQGLVESVRNILWEANKLKLTSLIIPTQEFTELNYPSNIIAEVLYKEMFSVFCPHSNTLRKVFIVVSTTEEHECFENVHHRFMRNIPDMGVVSNTSMDRIKLVIKCANISDEDCDVIACPTSEIMLLKLGQVSSDLLKKAGSSLQTECNRMVKDGFKLTSGEIAVTDSYNLKCKKIFFFYLKPFYKARKKGENCYDCIQTIIQRCLSKVEELKLKSICFPLIGCGNNGYNEVEVAGATLSAITKFGGNTADSLNKVSIVIRNKGIYTQFLRFFSDFFDLHKKYQENVTYYYLPKLKKEKDYSLISASNDQKEVLQQNSVIVSVLSLSKETSDTAFDVLKNFIVNCLQYIAINPELLYSQLLLADGILDICTNLEVSAFMTETKGMHILIAGESKAVLRTHQKILALMQKKERIIEKLKSGEWYYEDKNGSRPLTFEESFTMEESLGQKKKMFRLTDCMTNVVYINASEDMEECNVITGDKIRIKRMDQAKVPQSWAMQERPDCYFYPVSEKELKHIQSCFYKTIDRSKVNIVNIERIQNRTTYTGHISLRNDISRRNNKEAQITNVFHGCKRESIHDIVVNGFRRDFAGASNAANFGKGTYCALDASYSALPHYAQPDKEGRSYMFYCNFIICNSTRGSKDKTKPIKKEPGGPFYDTFVDNEKNPTIFVSTEDQQVYPAYLITFTR